ncbi:Syntaxin-18 [Armadillidium vulgare]|nr:Syntaxin-18 [Armadillidium vulgare]
MASVDVTTLFKSCVKTIRTRNKAIGITFPHSKILPQAPSTQFFSRARDIQANITSHERLLLDHRKKYSSTSQLDPNSLSDIERAYMDKVVSRNLKFIEENIRNLEKEIKERIDNGLSDHAKDCQQCVINILRTNFLRTNAYFRDMKDHRLKKQREKEQLFRLQRPSGMKKHLSEDKFKSSLRHRKSPEKRQDKSDSTSHKEESLSCEDSLSPTDVTSSDSHSDSPFRTSRTTLFDMEAEAVLQDLDEEERQILEKENALLFNELQSNQEEVKLITKQVVELSRMQDLFTENVEIQSQQIDEIHETILHATDNVQRGNEQVREAMRKDAGFRVWIMFFLIVMSLTILFLDWYNP